MGKAESVGCTENVLRPCEGLWGECEDVEQQPENEMSPARSQVSRAPMVFLFWPQDTVHSMKAGLEKSWKRFILGTSTTGMRNLGLAQRTRDNHDRRRHESSNTSCNLDHNTRARAVEQLCVCAADGSIPFRDG